MIKLMKLSDVLNDVKNNKESSPFKDIKWTTKDRRKIPFKDLSLNHLENIIKRFGNKHIEIKYVIKPISEEEIYGKGFNNLTEEEKEIFLENYNSIY